LNLAFNVNLRYYALDQHALKLQMRLLAHDAALRKVDPDCVAFMAEAVGTHGYCSPHQQTHFEPWLFELHGIL